MPLSWFEVKQHLETLPQDFISYSGYINICAQRQITEEQNQEQLITVLHNLGLVLNFRDHPLLQNTNVLKPEWVTGGIYALLSDDSLKAAKGILTPADLSRILDPQRYPPQRHLYLTELMREFQLGFQLDCTPAQIPHPRTAAQRRTPRHHPARRHPRVSVPLPHPARQHHLPLHRPQSHEKIHDQTYWRSGVMLAYTENGQTYNLACIKADPEDKKIFISINGRENPPADRSC